MNFTRIQAWGRLSIFWIESKLGVKLTISLFSFLKNIGSEHDYNHTRKIFVKIFEKSSKFRKKVPNSKKVRNVEKNSQLKKNRNSNFFEILNIYRIFEKKENSELFSNFSTFFGISENKSKIRIVWKCWKKILTKLRIFFEILNIFFKFSRKLFKVQ